MEALKNLITNVPDWLKRLDELNGQIEQRQIELARLTEASEADGNKSGTTCARSVRNKGSTESLKPRDEPEAHPRGGDGLPPLDADDNAAAAAAGAAAAAARANTEQQAAPPSPADSQSPSALQRQTNQMRAAGQARARATLRKRQRTDSVVSAEGATPKYRTRSMIIVYYDSYVQMFFEELVKFVSASRNMMRKAKMAAKVAQIKRLAELEMPDDDDDEETTDGATPATGDALPAKQDDAEPEPPMALLQYRSTRRMGGGLGGPQAMLARAGGGMYYTRAGGGVGARGGSSGAVGPDGKPTGDVYDELDRGLDYVQSMCEHAAHQFLRDGDCADEVAGIQRRLAETKELADGEMDRVKREEPEALLRKGPDDEQLRGRSYRPQSMRRDMASPKEAAKPAGLAVDEGVEDVDDEVPPMLVYKSTRLMR